MAIRKFPKASIILITCGRLDLLKERSLPSALGQDYPNFKVIVVDDFSNDGTEKFMKDFSEKDKRVIYIRHGFNKGASAARNTGVRRASGDYVVFLDDDNALLPNFLNESIPVLESLSKEYGALSVGRFNIYSYGREYILPQKDEDSFYTTIDDGWLMRRAVFDKILWDEELYHDEDVGLGISFYEQYKARALNKPLFLKYVSRTAGKQSHLSFGRPSEKRMKGLDNLVKKYLPVFEKANNKTELTFIYRHIGKTYAVAGHRRRGIKFLWKAFKATPSLRNCINLLVALSGSFIYKLYLLLETNLIQFFRIKF